MPAWTDDCSMPAVQQHLTAGSLTCTYQDALHVMLAVRVYPAQQLMALHRHLPDHHLICQVP